MTEKAAKVWQHLVRGAEIDCEYLDDLTTTGTQKTGHTNQYDWGGTNPASLAYPTRLHAHDAEKPKKPIPGLQIDGYFLDDDSSTTRAPQNSYGNKRYPHDSQFVIRFPVHWNRKLVVTSAPGLRGQYANDFIIGDFVLAKGYAFASTDKGNSGLRFYSADQRPGEAVFEWHRRINQLTEAAKDAAEKYYGESPYRTYITGNSNAGYVTRYALENHPDVYDGGVDWQGPLWIDPESPIPDRDDKGPNLLTFLPVALKYYPRYVEARDKLREMSKTDLKYSVYKEICQFAYKEITDAGFPGSTQTGEPAFPCSGEVELSVFQLLWDYHHTIYWGSTEGVFREEFDPYYPGAEADYKYKDRIDPAKNLAAQLVKSAVKNVSLTGNIGKPLITLHGTLDTLLPITHSSDKYAELIHQKDKADLHRYYKIEGGTHVDSLYDYEGPDLNKPNSEIKRKFREKLRPILPCYRAAFDRLVDWVEDGVSPPDNQTVPKPEGDVVNSCSVLGNQE
jgi:Tannase and feruloyl esterase/3HB-oligomer hydrolase (3HBOH)